MTRLGYVPTMGATDREDDTMKVRGDATASRYGFTIEWSPYGGFTLYRMQGNDYVSRRFFYYTVKDACRVFRSELRGTA